MISAIGFDLGHTLSYTPGIPMSWIAHYRSALCRTAEACGYQPSEGQLADAEGILVRYNTRLTPRSEEVPAKTIFGEVLQSWDITGDDHLTPALEAFFSYFLRESAVYTDVLPTLAQLHAARVPMGILTDVAYGMPNYLMASHLAPFHATISVVLSSVDIGFRKPAPAGYLELARRLAVAPTAMAFVGDEEKDIVGAQAVGMFAVFLDRKNSERTFGEDAKIHSLCELTKLFRHHP